MTDSRIEVVGAGVSGLTTAIALLEAGYAVRLHSAERPEHTTSSVAAAMWHPFFQAPDANYHRRALATFGVLSHLANDIRSGVDLRPLTELFRSAVGAPWWMSGLDEARAVAAPELPPGYRSAYTVVVPVADTSIYLPYLSQRFLSLGGSLLLGSCVDVHGMAGASAAVVNCTGAANIAMGDCALGLSRGVVLRASKPDGFEGCLVDDSNETRPTYIVERRQDVVLGGFAQPWLLSTQPCQADVDDILQRCSELVPAVAGVIVHEARVGFRPIRREPRVEPDPHQRNLIHNYGHGGSGYTLSWGCAHEVLSLIDQQMLSPHSFSKESS